MLKQSLIIFLFVCYSFLSGAQYKEIKMRLPKELNEISGLELVNDSILVAINDGGNAPSLYFLSLTGKIVHKTHVIEVKNTDWEDLTIDNKGFLYIADVGNNLNNRKDLNILKVNLKEALLKDSITADVISYHYSDQHTFPPTEDHLDFDCEAIYFASDSLYLITKSRANPWHGNTHIYSIPSQKGNYSAQKIESIFIGSGGWMKDAITAVYSFADEIYLLTYSELITCEISDSKWSKKKNYAFKMYTQKEAIAVHSKSRIYIAAERYPILGGPYLYTLTLE